MEKSASEVLRAAKALIGTPEKWCRGQFQMGDQYCAQGAIAAARGMEIPNWVDDPSFDALKPHLIYLERVVPPPPYDTTAPIGLFNNDRTTTHADVMAAFDRAIALAEADEGKQQPWTMSDTKRVLDAIVSTTPGEAQAQENALNK